jgi:hypothetical protein
LQEGHWYHKPSGASNLEAVGVTIPFSFLENQDIGLILMIKSAKITKKLC